MAWTIGMTRAARDATMLATLLLPITTGIAQRGDPIHSKGNPILSDGSFYSTDPAPFVVGDTLYILAGRDEAPPGVNDFVMKEWQLFTTKDVASGNWLHYPNILRPETLFTWAAPGHAYAGQIIQGHDNRFYLYAPVQEANSKNEDTFAIGVAIADSPLGPWKDAHPSGPIISQSTPEPNHIQNIDPTIFIDDDGRVYLYWGTFGQLRGIELAADMVTPLGKATSVHTLQGFFEAPWLFKRAETYYMVYAGNNAGPTSPCTPAVYHACIAYGTAPSPLGPWTYQGVMLDPVSSTTSHPGVVQFRGSWYLVYHTADAKGGNHFRRSVAIDSMQWDDSVQPARILKVRQTHVLAPAAAPTRNIAGAATASASNQPVPVQYWIKALNDGIVRENPLPPDLWATWTPHNPPTQWIQYAWPQPVTLNASRMVFWADHPAGADEGIAPPASWRLEFWTGTVWQAVKTSTGYGTAVDRLVSVNFDSVTTRCLRATFVASGKQSQYAGVAVQEWEALAPRPQPPGITSPTASSTMSCPAK